MSDFLERPAFVGVPDSPMFAPGVVLSHRFEIRCHLGRGGMGDVYEASDRELGTQVALKTIRPEFAARQAAVEAMRREVTRARRVAHPNVARVFDLFTHTGDDGRVTRFLTMQLIEGHTLAKRLDATGPLTPADALPIIRGIAAALDEAHRLGIVHRDLKPGNVMLVAEPGGVRAVVTDFGLALDIGEVATAGPHGSEGRGGTAGYAAPEQFASGRVGPAADIYAFGVLLHEILTGVLPGEAKTTRPRILPRRWERAIAACCDPNAATRPSRAGTVVAGVTPSRQPIVPVLSAALIAAVSLAIAFLRLPDQATSTRQHPELVIADVMNFTEETELSGVSELLRRQLDQSPFVALTPVATVRQRLGIAPTARLSADAAVEAVRRTGTGFVGSSRLRRSGNGYVLTVRVRSVTVSGRGERSWVRSYEARDRTDLQQAIQRGASWIRTTLGEQAEQVPQTDHPVADITTDSWLALDLYTRAESLLSEGRQDDALALLNEAVRVEPEFASAWMRMGDVLMSRRQYDDAYRRWAEALRLVDRKDLGTREAYRIRGMFASDTHDYAEAERVYRLFIIRYPDDFAAYFYIARPMLMLGRTDEAISMLERASLKDPTAYAVPAQLAMFNLRAGLIGEVNRHVERLRSMGRTDWADCIDAQSLFIQGDYSGALRRFESLDQADDAVLRRRAPALRVALYGDLGRYDDAIAVLQHAERQTDDLEPSLRADRLLAIAALQLRAGRKAASRDASLMAMHADQSPVRIANAAALLSRAGFPDDAQRLATRLSAESPSRRVRADFERVAGEILLARGRNSDAWERFQAAAALEAPGIHLEYLARGAAAAGERGTALALYGRMARDPHFFWRYPDDAEPGRWRAAIEAFLQLARSSAPSADLKEMTALLRSLTLTPTAVSKETR